MPIKPRLISTLHRITMILIRQKAMIKKFSLLVLTSLALVACQTPSSSGGGSGAPGSPLPSIPGGGSPGSPSSPSEPSPPSPSQSSESGSESESSSTAESGESGEGSESDSEPPPGWEDDTSIVESEAGAEGEEGEVTFEESENSGEVSFEEPVFDDGGGLTQEELEELERELNESLGDFDEEIAREKTYAEERANESVADDPLGGVGTFESYEGDDEESGASSSNSQTASSSASSASSENSSAQSSSDSSENAGDVTGENAVAGEEIDQNNDDASDLPPDIPENIADDDIVARQIREAAENETDPALQEALWAEYRKYKNQ